MKFGIGDSVKVKGGVMCPDYEPISIAGWQGRIFDVDEDKETVGIRWDSVTLKSLPLSYIKESEVEGLDWSEMYLGDDEVEFAKPQDSEEDSEIVRNRLQNKYGWLDGDDAGERIFAVVAEVDEDDELDAWVEHLSRSLVFPFEAEVAEAQERGALRRGDRVSVKGIDEMDEMDEWHGVLVDVVRGKERFAFPLAELEVMDRRSRNYLPVKDYCYWYANHSR